MAKKIVVADLDAALRKAGVPFDGLALDRPGKPGITVDYQKEATPEQIAQAEQIIKDYDQEAVTATKGQPVTQADIQAAKTVNDLKALLIQLHNLQG
jgi:hypothetical protein